MEVGGRLLAEGNGTRAPGARTLGAAERAPEAVAAVPDDDVLDDDVLGDDVLECDALDGGGALDGDALDFDGTLTGDAALDAGALGAAGEAPRAGARVLGGIEGELTGGGGQLEIGARVLAGGGAIAGALLLAGASAALAGGMDERFRVGGTLGGAKLSRHCAWQK